MHVDHLIIGQGICGTFLSWYLKHAGKSFLIIDEQRPDTASRVAAGIINPVTGRRIVKTWMIDQLLSFARQAYELLSAELSIQAITQKNIVEFFPTPQMRLAFLHRFQEGGDYITIPEEQAKWRDYFNDAFGFGEIDPCYLVDVAGLLKAYRVQLGNSIREESFEIAEMHVSDDKILYRDITASSVIFCDGTAGASNPYFKVLPFAPNKGEVIWIQCNELPHSNIFKQGMNLIPWQKNVFWVGSSYEWRFDDNKPTEAFRQRVLASLKHWLKLPFEIVDHRASIRPATIERRPFIGFHPRYRNVGLLNGMGTKGCSLAPYFAKQMVDHITKDFPLHPEANIARFKNMLSKKPLEP